MSQGLEFTEFRYGSPGYESCLQIRREVFVGEQQVPEDREIEHEETSRHFLIRLGEIPVCTGRLRPIATKNILKFERIATPAQYRGQGFARKLMLALQDLAQREYANWTWSMGAQLSAVSFYEKLGWIRETNIIFMDAGIEHLTLVFPHAKENR
jgi:predicted GNAT family N-acyltransferase